jgi:hypothetical protein
MMSATQQMGVFQQPAKAIISHAEAGIMPAFFVIGKYPAMCQE